MAVAVREPARERARAIAFLLDAYQGVATKPGKGLPHAQAVADILRDAGYPADVQLAGLLHDVVEDTGRSVEDVREQFGDAIADMVASLTEDDGIRGYADRKHGLREQIAGAGAPVVEIALADKIATLRHALLTDTRVRKRKLTHYRAVLQLARDAGVGRPFWATVQELLDQIEARWPDRGAEPARRPG